MSKEKKPETPNLITGEDEAKLKELIKSLIKKELDEMTGTSAVPGFNVPGAFAQKGQRHGKKATDALKGMGFSVSKEIDEEEELDEKKDPKKKKEVKNKKKKPDADGDGVPDWADKHPGKNDADFKKAPTHKKDDFIKTITKGLKDLTEKESKLNEAVSRYIRLKENPKKNSYKVSLITQEITKMLREVDFLMNVNHRLKTEMDIPNESLWKRTSERMAEIKARLKSIGEKLRKL